MYSLPPKFDIRQRPPVYIRVRPAKRSEVRDYGSPPSLYTYLSLSMVLSGSYRREYRPLRNPLPLLSLDLKSTSNTPYEPFT